jgi:N-acetylglucosaminyldiphosphoundecaprenol N-acetyl-beta-D-mannosaminyltransferase
MEWAYRMFSDPARLVPRYATNAWFLLISLLRDWNEFVNSKFDESTPSTNQTQKT